MRTDRRTRRQNDGYEEPNERFRNYANAPKNVLNVAVESLASYIVFGQSTHQMQDLNQDYFVRYLKPSTQIPRCHFKLRSHPSCFTIFTTHQNTSQKTFSPLLPAYYLSKKINRLWQPQRFKDNIFKDTDLPFKTCSHLKRKEKSSHRGPDRELERWRVEQTGMDVAGLAYENTA